MYRVNDSKKRRKVQLESIKQHEDSTSYLWMADLTVFWLIISHVKLFQLWRRGEQQVKVSAASLLQLRLYPFVLSPYKEHRNNPTVNRIKNNFCVVSCNHF